MFKEKYLVGISQAKEAAYPLVSPYHPSEKYPEYPFSETSSEPNYAYQAVRDLFALLKMDQDNFGKKDWNPLKSLIQPKMTVVIKPNFVLSRHFEGGDIYSIITHPSILRAIADYCYIALKGEGKIIIADAPQYNCNFEELLEVTQLKKVKDLFGSLMEIYDLRKYWSKTRHFPSCLIDLPGDPCGSLVINLKKESAFYGFSRKFYGAVYNRKETNEHHFKERQEYEVSRTIFESDVLISVPKLKVHKKVGVTLNFKGLVGACTNKNFLVHYSLGLPHEGGDQFPEGTLTKKERMVIGFERWMYDRFLAKGSVFLEMIHRFVYGFLYLRIIRQFGFDIPKEKRILDAGNWYGNQSAWRMVADLAMIFSKKKRVFSLIDGIVSGENNGPLTPDSKPTGVIIGGENLGAVDLVATEVMGFDPFKLKQYNYLSRRGFIPSKMEEIKIVPGIKTFPFAPHPGWRGHIEK